MRIDRTNVHKLPSTESGIKYSINISICYYILIWLKSHHLSQIP